MFRRWLASVSSTSKTLPDLSQMQGTDFLLQFALRTAKLRMQFQQLSGLATSLYDSGNRRAAPPDFASPADPYRAWRIGKPQRPQSVCSTSGTTACRADGEVVIAATNLAGHKIQDSEPGTAPCTCAPQICAAAFTAVQRSMELSARSRQHDVLQKTIECAPASPSGFL